MNRRQKASLFRGLLYLLLVGGVVGLALIADWELIQSQFFNLEIARSMFPEVITVAAKNTVVYTLCAFALGLALGLLLALMKLSSIPPYRWIANSFIELFRGLPALLTIFLIGFGIPIAFRQPLPGGLLGQASIALGLVAAAYMAETIRAGIEAVPKGQAEAARSLGMSQGRTMFSIVIPQAFRVIIPPLTNEFILLIKDTSLIFVLGAAVLDKELTKFGRDLVGTQQNATPLIVVGLMYLAITLPLTRMVALLEKRNQRSR